MFNVEKYLFFYPNDIQATKNETFSISVALVTLLMSIDQVFQNPQTSKTETQTHSSVFRTIENSLQSKQNK